MGSAILQLKDVCFSTSEAEVLRELSHAYAEGKSTALIGRSGCGKSMMLKLSAGLLLPSRGSVLFRGRNIAEMNQGQNLAFRKESAVVFQNSALWANQSIYQSLELPLKIHYPEQTKNDRDGRIREVLEEVGYRRDMHIRPAALSTGEQKLVAFARALLCAPQLLFLDEWTESLDGDAAERLTAIVRRMKERGNTVIFVNQDRRIVRSLADCVLLLAHGKLAMTLTGEQFAAAGALESIIEKELAS